MPDAIIVGAGPTGCATAIALAQLGRTATLIERETFPRFRIGESLPPKIIPLLDMLGVRESVESKMPVRMAGTTTHRGDGPETHAFGTSELGYQVDRAVFDAQLLEHARAVGVQVVQAAVAKPTIDASDESRVTGVALDDGRELSAPFVVDASGPSAIVSRALSLRRKDSVRTLALYGRWQKVKASEEFASENTLFEMLSDGWLWSVLLPDGSRNVTLGLDTERVTPGTRDALYDEAVGRSRLLGPLLETADRPRDLRAHDATWYSSERYAGPGFFLAGDAAAFVDPLTSQGVYKGVASGVATAAAINTSVSSPHKEALATRFYEDSQRRFVLEYTRAALGFYWASPFREESFWRARLREGLAEHLDVTPERAAARIDRRENALALIRKHGGALRLEVSEGLALVELPVQERGRVVERPRFVSARGDAIEADVLLDHAMLNEALRSASLSEVFDAYARRSQRGPSAELGREISQVILKLVEEDLVRLMETE